MSESRIFILDLLDILEEYSDENNPLTQQDIKEILESKYGYKKVRRQTIAANIEKMIDHYALESRIRLAAEDDDSHNHIEAIDETKRRITDIYYQHKLSDPELLLMIDSILFSKHIALEERRDLIEKLESLSSKHLSSRKGNISSMYINNQSSGNSPEKTLFDSIREIDQAIITSKQISFKYNNYKVKGNKIILEPRKNNKGEDRDYLINPYYMAASNGRYYLICNYDTYNDVSLYRVDRITDIKLLDEPRKAMRDVEGLGENFNLNDYMEENIYMFGGKAENIKLSLKKGFLDEFIDWFKPEDIRVREKKDDEIIVRVKSNRMAMRRWALRYALYVRVLSPQSLVDEIKEDIQEAVENYNLE